MRVFWIREIVRGLYEVFQFNYSRVSNKHPWTFNLNEIFFPTQRQLVILDFYQKNFFPKWDFYWIPTRLIFSRICLIFLMSRNYLLPYSIIIDTRLLECSETLQVYLLTCMAYLFLISIYFRSILCP